jgi:hypothetical protein
MSEDDFITISNNKIFKPIWGSRVIVPEFEIFSNPIIRIADIKTRRFNLIDRKIRTWEIVIRHDNYIEIN